MRDVADHDAVLFGDEAHGDGEGYDALPDDINIPRGRESTPDVFFAGTFCTVKSSGDTDLYVAVHQGGVHEFSVTGSHHLTGARYAVHF